MTAFAVCLSFLIYVTRHRGLQHDCLFCHTKPDQYTDYVALSKNLRCGAMNRLEDSSPMCFSIWCHTPSWANIRTTLPISSWSRRSGTFLSGNVPCPSFPVSSSSLYSCLLATHGFDRALCANFHLGSLLDTSLPTALPMLSAREHAVGHRIDCPAVWTPSCTARCLHNVP